MTDALKNFAFEDFKKSCLDTEGFSLLDNKSILVTGGTGFMGKWIAELVSYINNTQNFNIQLYLLGRDIERFEKEVPHLADLPYIHTLEQDVRNVHDLSPNINYIIHAAGSPDNRDHVSQPLKTLETSYKGTLSILDAASRLPHLQKLIYISSHQVYGKNDTVDYINEQYLGKVEPSSINHLYAESKRVAETLCAVYRNNFRLPIVTIRPFAFIGPYQDLEKPWAINNFIRDGILGGPIRILGNGATIRSYLYASDMAYWILRSLIKGQSGEIYNLGSAEAISLDDLAAKIKNCINPNIEVLSKSSRENYATVSRLVPDNSKIIRTLGVKENFDLNTSINRTFLWNQLHKK